MAIEEYSIMARFPLPSRFKESRFTAEVEKYSCMMTTDTLPVVAPDAHKTVSRPR